MQVPVSATTSQVAGATPAADPSHALHGEEPTDEQEAISTLQCTVPVNACCALWLCTQTGSTSEALLMKNSTLLY